MLLKVFIVRASELNLNALTVKNPPNPVDESILSSIENHYRVTVFRDNDRSGDPTSGLSPASNSLKFHASRRYHLRFPSVPRLYPAQRQPLK